MFLRQQSGGGLMSGASEEPPLLTNPWHASKTPRLSATHMHIQKENHGVEEQSSMSRYTKTAFIEKMEGGLRCDKI